MLMSKDLKSASKALNTEFTTLASEDHKRAYTSLKNFLSHELQM